MKTRGLIMVDGRIRPGCREDGNPIHRTPEGIANFWRWFGDSLAVGADGAPLVMYHASHRDVQCFDRRRSLDWRRPSMDTVGSWFSDSPDEGGGAGMYARGEGAMVYPVYLAICRPKVYDTFDEFLREMHAENGHRLEDMNPRGVGCPEALRSRLKAQGYDGIAFSRTDNQLLHDEAGELVEAISRATNEYRDACRASAALGHEMTRQEGEPWQAKIDRLKEAHGRVRQELAACGGSTEFDRQYVWVAFEPEQIKSIFNSGGFDPADPAIDDPLYRERTPARLQEPGFE